MRQRGFQQPNVLTRQPSRLMLGYLTGIHLLALVAICLSGLNIWLIMFLWLAIICHGYHCYRQDYLLVGDGTVKRIVRDADLWLLELADGQQVTVELSGEIVVLDWFVALQFRGDQQVYRVVLWSDSADVHDFRQLCVWLRLNTSQMTYG